MISKFDPIPNENVQNIDQITAFRVKVEPFRFIADIQKDNSEGSIKKRPFTLKELTNNKRQTYQNNKIRSADFGLGNLSFQTSQTNQQTLQNTIGPNIRQQYRSRRRTLRKKLEIQKKPTSYSPLHGEGIYKQKDGSTVFGKWDKGKLIGKGKIIYPNGNIYSGQLKEYERHGKGILKYENGCKYQGTFANGNFQNFGTLFDEFGQVINRGIWKKGVLIEEDL